MVSLTLQNFSSLGLSKAILNNLIILGYETPTPIQSQAIPSVLEGRDLLGCAQTGTGKTAAFALPMLDRLHASAKQNGKGRRHSPRALILSPTRELACQIEESFREYGRTTKLRHVVIYGGVSQYHQVRKLDKGVDIIVATPGRLMDLMEQGYVDLSGIEIFVLDEADRMLDMGFIKPIRSIASEIPDNHQTLLFSATMPKNIRSLADSLLRDPVRVSVTPDVAAAPSVEQSLYLIGREHKPRLLKHLLRDKSVKHAVVFTRTKHGADKLEKILMRDGIISTAIHGNKSQNQRTRALDAFRSGKARVLVATDVAARGLDVDGITHVFNYDLPNEAEAYVHRIGRTGRAGATGRAISFCSRDELAFLRDIERLLEGEIDTHEIPDAIDIQDGEVVKRTSRPDKKKSPRRGGGGGGGRGGQSRSGRPANGRGPAKSKGAPHAKKAGSKPKRRRKAAAGAR